MGWAKFPFYESGQEEIGPGPLTAENKENSQKHLLMIKLKNILLDFGAILMLLLQAPPTSLIQKMATKTTVLTRANIDCKCVLHSKLLIESFPFIFMVEEINY